MSPVTDCITQALAAGFSISIAPVTRIGGAVDIEMKLIKSEAHRLPVWKTYPIRASEINAHGAEAAYANAISRLIFEFDKARR